MKLFIKICPVIFLFGCVHYFERENKLRSEVAEHHDVFMICLREGNSLPISKIISAENYKYGKLLASIKKEYPDYSIGCDMKKQLIQILISDSETELFGDFWKITLGIIPGVYEKVWEIQVYDQKDRIIWDKVSSGKMIVSIFFAPFFFLHKDPDEIIFEEINSFLNQLKLH